MTTKKSGWGGMTRTCGLLINSQALYQLSYSPIVMQVPTYPRELTDSTNNRHRHGVYRSSPTSLALCGTCAVTTKFARGIFFVPPYKQPWLTNCYIITGLTGLIVQLHDF